MLRYSGVVLLTKKWMRSSRFGPVELGGQRRELADAGDGAPGGAVERGVLGGAVEVHGADGPSGRMVKRMRVSPYLLSGGRASSGISGIQLRLMSRMIFSDVGAEVDALGVGEDLDAGVHSLVRHREVLAP